MLAGSWSVSDQGKASCTYGSDRGAVFAIHDVQEPDLQGGLADARSSCDTKPLAVRSNDSFACVERKDEGDLIVGNIVARNTLWVFVILAGHGGRHDVELKAMRALLGRVGT